MMNNEPRTDGGLPQQNKWGEGCCPNCGGIEATWQGRYKNKDGIWQADYECNECGENFSEEDPGIP